MTAGDPPPGDRRAATDIVATVRSWLAGLAPAQRARATFPFDTDERFAWQYTPGPRQGLAIGDMTPSQREAARAIVRASLSTRGAAEVAAVMALETVLGELELRAGRPDWERRDPQRYWFAVFGEPGDAEPWSWRVGGHHIAIHITLARGRLVGSAPSFLGANPAVVPDGPSAGDRALTGEEALARRLLAALTPAAWNVAVVDDTAPADILSGNGARAHVAAIPTGVRYAELDGRAGDALERLVRHYLGRVRPELAAQAWAGILADGLEHVRFAWAGPATVGHGHYYAVRGPGFLVEYDNTQDGANHIHAVWRDLANDWGEDLLAGHHATDHA